MARVVAGGLHSAVGEKRERIARGSCSRVAATACRDGASQNMLRIKNKVDFGKVRARTEKKADRASLT